MTLDLLNREYDFLEVANDQLKPWYLEIQNLKLTI